MVGLLLAVLGCGPIAGWATALSSQVRARLTTGIASGPVYDAAGVTTDQINSSTQQGSAFGTPPAQGGAGPLPLWGYVVLGLAFFGLRRRGCGRVMICQFGFLAYSLYRGDATPRSSQSSEGSGHE
jgi:hypothetical protein